MADKSKHDHEQTKDLLSNSIFLTYQEAFVSLVPYLFVSSIIVVVAYVWRFFEIDFLGYDAGSIEVAVAALADFFPIALMMAITVRFARRYEISYVLALLVASAVLVSVNETVDDQGSNFFVTAETSFLVLFIPIAAVTLLNLWGRRTETVRSSSGAIKVALHSVPPFVAVTAVLYAGCIALIEISNWLIPDGFEIWSVFGPETLIYVRITIEHLLWFVGLHGSNLMNIALGVETLSLHSFGELSLKQIYDVFIIYGGSGATMGLVLSAILVARHSSVRHISLISLPFTLFNINELVIYGLPVIFNRYLAVPFVFVPLLNAAIIVHLLPGFALTVSDASVPWITPVFVNAYLMFDGDLSAVALQFAMLALNTLIYLPFVRRYAQVQSVRYQADTLRRKLALASPLATRENLAAHRAERSIIKANEQVDKAIRLIERSELLMHYQPVVDIEAGRCDRFEALLRIRTPDGRISGPYFLGLLEGAGMAQLIDEWVCREVEKDLKAWNEAGFFPKIHVNLHPDTLNNLTAIERIQDILKQKNVSFEVVERGFRAAGHHGEAIGRLKEAGFTVSIDDFGSGYSSFGELCCLPFDSLKLDKSLIDLLDEPKGAAIVEHISAMCRDLGVDCVAEGVEHERQVKRLRDLRVCFVQGFYFSKALPVADVPAYRPRGESV